MEFLFCFLCLDIFLVFFLLHLCAFNGWVSQANKFYLILLTLIPDYIIALLFSVLANLSALFFLFSWQLVLKVFSSFQGHRNGMQFA